MFVGLVAPNLFRAYYEFPIGLGLCAAIAFLVLARGMWRLAGLWPRWGAAALAVVLCGYLACLGVEMWEMVPQAVNLNTWPATLFVGRDGRVKSIHAGFAAPASGEFNPQLKQEFTGTIERLLAEKPQQQTVTTTASIQ